MPKGNEVSERLNKVVNPPYSPFQTEIDENELRKIVVLVKKVEQDRDSYISYTEKLKKQLEEAQKEIKRLREDYDELLLSELRRNKNEHS
jgi:hypothetical protein